MAFIELDDVQKAFDGTPVLGPLTLDIEEGSVVALVGPSGCGKSTTLRLLAGLERADAGVLSVSGQVIDGPGADRVMMFQDAGLFPWLSVGENIALGLKAQNLPRRDVESRVDAWLDVTSLSDWRNKSPATLSGGMAQRAALARTLAPEPRIILLDEPFASLDQITRQTLQKHLLGLRNDSPATWVLVTHDVEEAIYLADRIVVMSARPGTIVADISIHLERDSADIRTSPEFIAARRAVEQALGF